MKYIITLIILLFTINIYSQDKIIEEYNITNVIYTENIEEPRDDRDIIQRINGNLIITEDNIQIKLNNKLVLTLKVISNPEENYINDRTILSFTAIDQENDYANINMIDYKFISITYLNNQSLGFLFE